MRRILGGVAGVLAIAVILLVIFWRWDWFVPLINRKATAALHRETSIAHLHVKLGLNTVVTVDDLVIRQPDAFKEEKQDFASARHITVAVKVWRYITGQGLIIPRIVLDAPHGDIVGRENGANNYTFGASDSSTHDKQSSSASGTSLPRIGELTITGGDIRVALAKLHADMRLLIHTTPARNGSDGTIVIDGKGRYAKAPITGHIVGGAIMTVADKTHPYPIDVHIENGPTTVALKGTVDDPLHFAGTKLNLRFAGPDMALLYPLTGVPIPHTPHYEVTGKLNYTANHIRFDNFLGRMGSSDIGGNIAVDPHENPPNLDADLHSHLVDLADLSGFIGGTPSDKKAPPPSTPAGHVLPDQKIDVPKLNAINAHLRYHGDHIENKKVPMDNIDADIIVHDGAIDVKKLAFAVGAGTLGLNATLNPVSGGNFATKMKVDVSRLDIARLMKSTGTFKGQGTLGGHVTLTSTGNSIANLVSNGNGGITLVVDHGGDVSALLPDLMGLKLGSAILSAIGVPDRSDLECFIADMPLRNGVLHTNSLLLMTDSTRTTGSGTVDFRTNRLDYSVTTRSVHMNVLSIPGAINITGPIDSPSIMPGAEVIGRAAAAVGLGIFFPPAALLPTIQFGVGKGGACETAMARADTHPAAGVAPGATSGAGKATVAPAPANGTVPARHGQKASPTAVHAAWEKKMHAHH